MSIEAWLTISGILVTLALSFVGLVISILAFFLKRELSRIDQELRRMDELDQIYHRIGRCEGALGLKKPSTVITQAPEGTL